ncbi:hypothetical protein [Maribellus sp. YY47]|uniref:hypothetical protein n=1 Tax=Maribellus sp. YY47 TaxID=2929486 RepID=UPI0020007456|nr:hypothetical protein [Maribellus sp. YY47]MCK3684702.1 hypothetical protein [Maribellus sp. YY47]
MKTIFFLAFSFAFILSGFSQSFVISDLSTLSDHVNVRKGDNNALNGKYYEHIDGSPFLNNEFQKGIVSVNDTLSFKDVPLRYNIFTDKIEFKDRKDQVLEINDQNQDYYFLINQKQFKTAEYIYENNTKRGVLEILVRGHVQLYKRYQVKFEPATKAIGFQDAQPDRFVSQDAEYFLAVDNEKPREIKLNKKDIFSQLEPFKADIEKYAKAEKLNTKSEKDLVQLVQYCNK